MFRTAALLAVLGCCSAAVALAEEPRPSALPSPKAAEAIRLLDATELYDRQVGFLRLEALREPATLEAIKRYLDDRNPEVRAYSLRAVAAIEGVGAIPLLLERLRRDRAPSARRAALLGLEPLQAQDPQILPAFIAALKERSTEIRITAVDIVNRIDDPRAREAIAERHKRERRRDVRRLLWHIRGEQPSPQR